ncbi:MAG: LOG family protein [Ignavibacteriales bacterium]|nr:LOG family protein [Ignavibacteriales bacterium]
MNTITVFGSSMPKNGEPEYEEAYLLGKMLAKNGYNVCSGGSLGIMDAVSKGAVEEGKEAIGVTVALFNSPSSRHLTREIKCDTLFQRLDNLISHGDGFIILPGGTGTLLEVSLIWELFNKEVLAEKPVATLGSMWRRILSPMEERVKYEKRKNDLIQFFDDSKSIVEYLNVKLNNRV